MDFTEKRAFGSSMAERTREETFPPDTKSHVPFIPFDGIQPKRARIPNKTEFQNRIRTSFRDKILSAAHIQNRIFFRTQQPGSQRTCSPTFPGGLATRGHNRKAKIHPARMEQEV